MDASTLRHSADAAEAQAKRLREQVNAMERDCQHQWTEVQKDYKTVSVPSVDFANPIIQGVHIDYRTRYHDERRPYWFRTCTRCLKREETTETKDQVTKVPAFR